jgi:hypothetical protein
MMAPYRLTARVDGRVRSLPVRSRGAPFDVDLGPDGHGSVVAAYSRCRREPDYVLPDGSLPQPTYSRGVACDIYRYAPVDGPLVSQASTESATFAVRRTAGGFQLDEYRGLVYTPGLPLLAR